MKILIGHTNLMPQILLRKPLPGRENCGDEILAFGNGYTQISHTPGMDWNALTAGCPAGWTPDLYVHWSPEYNAVPFGIESAGCKTVGVFGDWNLGGSALRSVGAKFDLLVADTPGAEAFRRAGFERVLPALLWGYHPQLHRPAFPSDFSGTETKDIDLLMIGSFNHEIQRERARWLARTARLSKKYRVVLTTGLQGEEYVRMTHRAKIVFNRSIRGELNMRAYEAAACGALHLMERSNREFCQVFEDRASGVLYGEDDFEALVEYYLDPARAKEREQIASAGLKAVEAHTYAHHLGDLLNRIEAFFAASASPAPRPAPRPPFVQWLLSADSRVIPTLETHLEAALAGAATDQERGEILSLSAFTQWQKAANLFPSLEKDQTAQRAFHRFAEAFETDPANPLARYNHGYALILQGFRETGVSLLQETLRQIESEVDLDQNGLALPRVQDGFRLEWEQIFRDHAPGSPRWKSELRRWLRARILLTLSETAYAEDDFLTAWRSAAEAALQNPAQIPILYSKARASRALGKVDEALEAYRQTTEQAPFHWNAWEERVRLLIEVGKAGEAVPLLEDLETRIRACTYYAPHRPALLQLLREARMRAKEENGLPNGTRLLAFPNWSETGDWQELVSSFAQRYHQKDPVLLMLRADPNTAPAGEILISRLQSFLLNNCGVSGDAIPRLTLLHEPLEPKEEWRLFHAATEVLVSGELTPFRRTLAEFARLPIQTLSPLPFRADRRAQESAA